MLEDLKLIQQCPFKISDIELLKKYNQIQKRAEKLLKIEFDSEPVYADNDKYIKIKVKIYAGSILQIFRAKNSQKKKHHASVHQLQCWILLSKQGKSIILKHSWKNANINKKR